MHGTGRNPHQLFFMCHLNAMLRGALFFPIGKSQMKVYSLYGSPLKHVIILGLWLASWERGTRSPRYRDMWASFYFCLARYFQLMVNSVNWWFGLVWLYAGSTLAFFCMPFQSQQFLPCSMMHGTYFMSRWMQQFVATKEFETVPELMMLRAQVLKHFQTKTQRWYTNPKGKDLPVNLTCSVHTGLWA